MSSGKAFPERILYSTENAKFEYNPSVVEGFIQDAVYEDDFKEYLSLEEHEAIVAELKAQNEDLYKIAQEWMHDYDKLKNKYEPMIAVTSEDE